MWQGLAKLVPPVPQNKVQGRQDDEREKPQQHAEVVHPCAAEPPKEDRSGEQLKGERKKAGGRERVTGLGSLEVNSGSDEHMNVQDPMRTLKPSPPRSIGV